METTKEGGGRQITGILIKELDQSTLYASMELSQ
jgi:hypothetical protein